MLLLISIHFYDQHCSSRFIASTFYWKAVVLHFTAMSWDIIV
jgi:hypothetical protein